MCLLGPTARVEVQESEDLYEVEKVLEMRKGKNNITEYLVQWKGWKGHDTWEPLSHLKDEGAQGALDAFMAKVSSAERQTKRMMMTSRRCGRKTGIRRGILREMMKPCICRCSGRLTGTRREI